MPKRYRDYDDEPPRRHRTKGRHKKKKGPSPVVIGLAVAGGVVLLAVAGLAVWLWDRGGSDGPTGQAFPGMVAHWPLNEAEGERLADKTGRGNDGKFVGGGFGPGMRGNAWFADGRDDQYIDLGRGTDLNFAAGAEFTVAAWFQTREPVGTVVSFRHSTSFCQLDLFVRDGRALVVVADDQAASDGIRVQAKVPNDGGWHHAAVTRSGKTIELYLDGESQGTETAAQAGGPITTDLRAIGCNLRFVQDHDRRFGRAGFKGGIDEVYVFSRALKTQEIAALMKR